MSDAVICEKISKIYGEGSTQVHALTDINLSVKQGELLMLVGPSGSGKTTLISIIAGILSQSEGVCRLFDTDIHALENGAKTTFRGKTIGFVFQAYNLIPSLTVMQNVSVPRVILGESNTTAEAKAKEMLDKVGLSEKVNNYPNQLSGGQQQRVAIARAIVHDPKLIVCDEPTSALDHETGKQVMDLLQSLVKESGVTLVVVTHDSRIFEYADRIIKLEDGRITEVN